MNELVRRGRVISFDPKTKVGVAKEWRGRRYTLYPTAHCQVRYDQKQHALIITRCVPTRNLTVGEGICFVGRRNKESTKFWAETWYYEGEIEKAELDSMTDSIMGLFAGRRSGQPKEEVFWWQRVLGIKDRSALDTEALTAHYWRAAKKAHPDKGGTRGQMAKVNLANEAAKEYLKQRK